MDNQWSLESVDTPSGDVGAMMEASGACATVSDHIRMGSEMSDGRLQQATCPECTTGAGRVLLVAVRPRGQCGTGHL